MRPFKLVLSGDWSNLDEKPWVEKYLVVPYSDFRWKALLGKNSSYIMSYENKAWIRLIGLFGYISYLPLLVSKKFRVIQHVPKTWGLAEYTVVFKNSSSLAELEAIRHD
jgi:hypothetical protein